MVKTKIRPSRGRPRKLIHDQGLQIAKQLFLQFGFDNVSIAELCAKLDCPPTSLYSTYGNKTALFTTCLNAYAKEFFDVFEKTLSNSDSSAELFRNTLESTASFYIKNNQCFGCLILNGSTFCKDEQVIDLVDQKAKLVTQLLTARLQELDSNNVDELANVLVTLIRGIESSIQTGEDEESILTSIEFFCMTFD